MSRLFMTPEEVEESFGQIEYENLSKGWVRITNDFEKKNMILAAFPVVGNKYVHRKIVPALSKALHVIERNCAFEPKFEYITDMQVFAPRHVGNDKTKRLSCHSYGIAFDINPWENMPGNPGFKMPQPLIEVFENVGFIWGGRMKILDYMHFEPARNFIDFENRW